MVKRKNQTGSKAEKKKSAGKVLKGGMKPPKERVFYHKYEEPDKVAEFIYQELLKDRKKYEALGFAVKTLSAGEILSKVTGQNSHSPHINQFAHNTVRPRGSTESLTIWVTNPDSFLYYSGSVIGHVFFGPGNILSNSEGALISTDTRFPAFGNTGDLQASSTTTWQYLIGLPSNITRGVYVVNLFLFKRRSFDTGEFLDRISYELRLV
jgi:hypothetical protein